MKPIQIFKAGQHQDSISQQTITFSEADLRAAVAAYDPAKHEAPLTIGHPKGDKPAYGWVKSLSIRDGAIDAEPAQTDAAFEELVQAGRFKKVSAAFYAPTSSKNPVPGSWYLRHVAFLGAQPPEVKGLRAVEFADEASDGVVSVEFGETSWTWSVIARLFRRMRDQVVADKGIEEADKLLPEWDLAALAEAGQPKTGMPSVAYSEPESSMPDQNIQLSAEREAALTAREQAAVAREAQFAEREQRISAAESERVQSETVAFVESLEAVGKTLPRDRAGLVAVLTARSVGDSVAFGEGEDKFEGTASAWLRKFLETLPKQVEFSELAAAEASPAQAAGAIKVPRGYTVRPEKAALHFKAVAFAEANSVDYVTAVQSVQNAG